MNDFQKFFGTRLQSIREAKGVSRDQVAKSLGFNGPSQISRYELGKAFPNCKALNQIASILDVDLNWLITGEYSSQVRTAINQLEPFARSHLEDINKRRRDLAQEAAKLQPKDNKNADVVHIIPQAGTNEPKMIGLKKVQDVFRFHEINDEMEELRMYYDTVSKFIDQALAPFKKTE
jgi:transcriptional regulator with XRE-family HTH domain